MYMYMLIGRTFLIIVVYGKWVITKNALCVQAFEVTSIVPSDNGRQSNVGSLQLDG